MNRAEFLATFGPLCEAYGKHYGIPPQIMLAQIAVESAWGAKPAPGTKNNFCGMKWTKGQWKKPGREVKALENQNTSKAGLVKARFAEFVSPEHCVGYLAETLAFSSHYLHFRKMLADDTPVKDALDSLAMTYCSDVKYADTLAKVMRDIDRLQKDTVA